MAQSIDADMVRQVATLARLRISEDEVQRYVVQLASIFNYVDLLNEVNTDNVEPLTHALPITNVLREDAIRPSLTTEQALTNAPQAERGFFVVPKVLDQESS